MKEKLVPGQVYRRASFAQLTSNVDRNLAQLVKEGSLKKLSYGKYVAPKKTVFGESLPDENSLIETFLNDDHFVVYSPNQFNSLGLGTTQLYNKTVVFNRKRSGYFELGGRGYYFYRWREAPKKLTTEFLVVELLNKLDNLSEDRNSVLNKLQEKSSEFNMRKLKYAVEHYGNITAKKLFKKLIEAH
tara:strand:+ start:562 stop:1122 length:561 start_codon:yes stop_codon:yes gene_type:complete